MRETAIAEFADDEVQRFYTEYPYPPPVENLDRVREQAHDTNRQRAEYHLTWPNRPYRSDLKILVAGCGTWQAAKYALCRPSSTVVGIDVSKTSLDHTERLKRKYNLTNLELDQVPLERVSDLGEDFDLIVCTGVLHHLADPDMGLRALASVLSPAGAIYLMVYATYGRAGVYMIQDYCRRLGIGTSVTEINDLATMVESMPPQHPLVNLLRSSRDPLFAEALADALLNPRDQSYTVPEFLNFIERNGLEFGRWYWQAPYLPQCGSIATIPHAARLSALAEYEQYAALELLRGTMISHSAIVYRQGSEVETWRTRALPVLNCVPHRLPNTMQIRERLPVDVAAVLLNQSHQFHDLILMIDEREKRMFDAMDGKRTVEEIVGVNGSKALGFFGKLWDYDQIVFDAS